MLVCRGHPSSVIGECRLSAGVGYAAAGRTALGQSGLSADRGLLSQTEAHPDVGGRAELGGQAGAAPVIGDRNWAIRAAPLTTLRPADHRDRGQTAILQTEVRQRYCRQRSDSDAADRGQTAILQTEVRQRYCRQRSDSDTADRGQTVMLQTEVRQRYCRQRSDSDTADRGQTSILQTEV